MRVLAFVPDLMDRSRMRAPGAEVVFVSDPSELVGAEADLVVLDLSRQLPRRRGHDQSRGRCRMW